MTTVSSDWEAFVRIDEDGAAHMDLAVEGITCAACMVEIERGLSSLDGVRRARLNLTSHRLSVVWKNDEAKAETVLLALERMGYKAHPFDPAGVRERADREGGALLRALAVAGFASMNIMLLSVSVWSGNATDISPATRDLFHWISACIALPAAAYSGRIFFRSAFSALKARRLNMDVPIVIGVSLALFLSVVQTVHHSPHVYFESALMLLFFLLVGRVLDHNMRRKTRSFAENIAALKAEAATLIDETGALREAPLSKVPVGALTLVRAGERIALDGVIEKGNSELDQSLVNGETRLKAVRPGDVVFAGMQNIGGNLEVRVQASSGKTFLDEVNKLLETAAQEKSGYVRLADRAASFYSPLVHAAAAMTFLGWFAAGMEWQQALVIAISVLIITCPCALGLAIPAVQVVTSGVLFRSGILLHSGDALERLSAVDTIVFDKTGTLTLARPELINRSGLSEETLQTAGRLALASRHPLAGAVARACAAEQVMEDAVEETGGGVRASCEKGEWRLGSPAFCGVEEVRLEAAMASHPEASRMVLREPSGEFHVLLLQQTLRADAKPVIESLRRDGYDIIILSGDRKSAVAHIAQALGVENWEGALTPGDKMSRLGALKQSGRKVLMVGDGLNDAPALAMAYASLSPVTAVHLAQAAADAAFLGEELLPVRAALVQSKRSHRAMVQNLWLSALYNLIAVPFAVAGYVTPLVAALAMSGSSIAVTANALRLRWEGKKKEEAEWEPSYHLARINGE